MFALKVIIQFVFIYYMYITLYIYPYIQYKIMFNLYKIKDNLFYVLLLFVFLTAFVWLYKVKLNKKGLTLIIEKKYIKKVCISVLHR